MAEGGGWWGSFSGVVTAAKNKSAEVLEFVKRDLDELSSTVKHEASHVVSSTTSVLKEQLSLDQPESTVNTMKRSMSSFLGTVNNVLNPAPDDSDQEAMIIKDNVPVVLTRFQAQLHTLMTLEETYIEEPKDTEAAQFSAWLDIQEDLLNSDNLTKLMMIHAELHVQYSKLVPAKVTHADFWQRFLFRRALLEDEEARRQAHERRLEREASAAEWFLKNRGEDFPTNNVDISEEEQIRLLQEYEKECKQGQSEGNDVSTSDSASSTPRKLHMKENHYADSKSPESEMAFSDPESEPSIITDAKNRIFSLVKTAMDSLDLLDVDTETEVSSLSISPKDEKERNVDSADFNENTTITVKEKADMVILGNDKDDTDTGAEDTPDHASSSSSSSSATLPDDEWERLQVVDE